MADNTLYTPKSFLEAEYQRVANTWFWKAFMSHLEIRLKQHTALTFANASGDEKDLRVSAAMASALDTMLNIPQAMREGRTLLPGQVLGTAPKRTQSNDPSGDEEDGNASS